MVVGPRTGGIVSYQPSDPSQTPPTPAQVQPPVADPPQLPVPQPSPSEQALTAPPPTHEPGAIAPPPYEPVPMAPPPTYEPGPMGQPAPYQTGSYQPGPYQPGPYQTGPYQPGTYQPPMEPPPPYQAYQPVPGAQPAAYQQMPTAVTPVAYAGPMPRSKTTAVLLAVFLGFWTWLYTYRRDAALFWINLVLAIVTVGAWNLVSWPWAIICAAIRDETFYGNYPYGR